MTAPGNAEPYRPGALPVVLDTDLGTDVDDLLGLILLAGEPRVDLRAITTVYGDVLLRARIARRALRLMGREDVPVHAGEDMPQSGREVWWPGHEGRGMDALEAEKISAVSGVDALLDAARHHPGELVVVAIGPLTNIAAALDRDPSWAHTVRSLVVMGGEFSQGMPEHNIRSDVVAAAKVLASAIPTLFVGLDVTTTVWFDEPDLTTVTASDTALARTVDRQVRQWWRFLGGARNNPHDPLAVLALLEPEMFATDRGRWQVVDQNDQFGALRPADDGPVIEYVTTVDHDAAQESIVRRLTAAIADEQGA